MNKYNAQKTEIDGIKFDSKKEAGRYQELKLLSMTGKISRLMIKPVYTLTEKNDKFRQIKYIADFQYYGENGLVVEDVKGYKGGAGYQVFKIKQKLMYDKYGIEVVEI